MRLSKLYLWAVCLTMLAGLGTLFAVVLGLLNLGVHQENVTGTGLLVVSYFLFGLGCAAVRDHGRAPRLMLSGMVIGAAALVLFNYWIWAPLSYSDQSAIGIIALWPSAAALSTLAMGLMLLPKPQVRPRWWRTLRFASIVLVGALTLEVCIIFTIVDEQEFEYSFIYHKFIFSVMMPLFLLASLGFGLTMITAWLPMVQGSGISRDSALGTPYLLVCPRCAVEQQARTGEHHCIGCGLRARVELA